MCLFCLNWRDLREREREREEGSRTIRKKKQELGERDQ